MATHHNAELQNSCGPHLSPNARPIPSSNARFSDFIPSQGERSPKGNALEPKTQNREPSTKRRVSFVDKNQVDSKPLEEKSKEKSFSRGILQHREEPTPDPKCATFADSDHDAGDHCRKRQCQLCAERVAEWVSNTTEGQIAEASWGFQVYSIDQIMRDDFLWPDMPVFVRETFMGTDSVCAEVGPVKQSTAKGGEIGGRDERGGGKGQERSLDKTKTEGRNRTTARAKVVAVKPGEAGRNGETVKDTKSVASHVAVLPPNAEPRKTPADLAREQIAAARGRDLGNGHRRRGSHSPISEPGGEYQGSKEPGFGTVCFNLVFVMFFFSAVCVFVIHDIRSFLG